MYLETLRDRIYVIHRNSVYDGERLTPKKSWISCMLGKDGIWF